MFTMGQSANPSFETSEMGYKRGAGGRRLCKFDIGSTWTGSLDLKSSRTSSR
jgi:hypothetical protein